MEVFLSTNDAKGLTSLSFQLKNKCNVYLRFFVLLYADNTMLFSESSDYLQHRFVVLIYIKCGTSKTLVIKHRLPYLTKVDLMLTFHLSMYRHFFLENVDNFEYLGLHFCKK